jgi:hypothetical protein
MTLKNTQRKKSPNWRQIAQSGLPARSIAAKKISCINILLSIAKV